MSALDPRLAREFGLAGRVAVVTGAASGIGRACAVVLAEAGAQVVLADIDRAGLAETATLIGAAATVQPTDMARRAEIAALAAAALGAHGRLDIWVNCAAILVRKPIVEAEEADIDRVIAVNLKGVYAGCAEAAKAMRATGAGAIVNISSAGGESSPPGLSIYAMTKAGVNAITRSAAREFGTWGIRVNGVAPGWVDTPLGTGGFRDASGALDPTSYAAGLKARAAASPLGITGEPRDIALAVLYLASDAARFVTGQLLRPNGGIAMP